MDKLSDRDFYRRSVEARFASGWPAFDDLHDSIGAAYRAVMEIISEQGFPGLSMRAIATRAGLSLGTLTYHFAGKADLVSGCLDHFVEAEFSRIMTLAQEVDDPVLALEIGVRSQIEISLYPVCRKFDFAYWAHAEHDAHARQHMDNMTGLLRQNTAHLICAAFPGRDANVALRQAAVIQALIEGMSVAMPADESRCADLGLVDFYEDTVQSCLGIAAQDTLPVSGPISRPIARKSAG